MLDEKTNRQKLNDRISKLEVNSKIILAFDFDELVVPVHLTRKVTQAVSDKPDLDKLDGLGSCSFEGILYLNSLLNGLSVNEYEGKRDELAKETPWRDGFRELLEELMENYSIVFISSGMKDIAESKLKEIGINPNNIFGGEFNISENKIDGSSLVVTDKLKGYIIEKIKEKGKVIGVGHGKGDRIMLENSDVSIGFNSDVLDLAECEVKYPEEILQIVKNNS